MGVKFPRRITPRPPTPRGRSVPGREKPVERSPGTRGGAHSPIQPFSDARDALPAGSSSHAGEPPRRPRATVRRAGRRRDSGASGEGFRARPGVAPHCRPIRRRAPRRRPFLAFAASAARLRDPTREGSRGFRAAFTETDCETVSTHDRSQAPAERPWSMLNGSGSGRPPIRECEILDPGALEHETPRCQTRSTDYTTHGLPECQSNDASRVGRYAGRLRDRRNLRSVGRRPGGDIANPVPGQVSLSNVRERSPGPGNRPCFESASPVRAEPAAVPVSVGVGLRGCGILHCRFAGRRARRVVPLRIHLQGHAR